MNRYVLETGRLVLEELSDDHFNDLYALLSNDKVHKYFPKTLNEQESRDFLDQVRERYHDDGYCFWAVIRKNDGRFLGICGLLKQFIDDREETEVAYRISDEFWGNGYGAEAARGCISYAKKRFGKQSVIALIREVNKQSIRVAEKCGMVFEKEAVFLDTPHRVYRI